MKHILIYVVAAILLSCAPQASKNRPAKHAMRAEEIINYDSSIDAQLESLARQTAIQLTQTHCGHIGMKGFFDVKGRSRRLEKYMEIEFTNRLLRIGHFQIHTPQDLIQIEENKMAPSARDESAPSSASGSAKADGIQLDSYLIGSTVEFPQAVKVSVRIISSKTGSVFGTASVMIHKDRIVESLMDNFGEKRLASIGNSNFRVGEVIKTGENQYIDLIPGEYILYVKQINFEYSLFTDSFSNVEIFLNEDFRIMKENEMISISYDNARYILALRDVADRVAVFTFAHLNDCRYKTTGAFSLKDQTPYDNEKEQDHPEEIKNASSASGHNPEAPDSSLPDSSAEVGKTEPQQVAAEPPASTEKSEDNKAGQNNKSTATNDPKK